MKPQKQMALFVVLAFAVGLAALIVVAVRTQGPGTWTTFWPDLIIGLIGAGAIAALIYLLITSASNFVLRRLERRYSAGSREAVR